jgi:hypothetical protein
MILRRYLAESRGSAATEFAMILPMLIIVLFVGSEAGHFVWTQHKLTEAVRNGARYAARLEVTKVCDGPTAVLANPELANIRLLTRTGQLASNQARSVVPGWTDAQVDVEVSCESFVDTGIYYDLGAAGPIVTVRAANVAYPYLFGALGGLGGQIALNARSNAAVIGL